MRLPTPALLGIALFGLLFVAVACGEALAEGDCLAPEDGQLVAVPCTTEGTPLPTPTPTLAPSNGGGNGGSGNDGDTDGRSIFLGQGTCFICHTIDDEPLAGGQVGPNLSQVGLKGEEYLRESIMFPNAVIATDCPGGPCPSDTMIPTFGELFSEEQIDALVDYLLTLQ